MLSIENLHAVFGTAPTGCLVLYPDAPLYTIAYANKVYLDAVNRTGSDIIGKPIYEAFPQNSGKTASNSNASLEHVLLTKTTHNTPLYKFDLYDKQAKAFETRFWSCDTYPLLDEEGTVAYIVRSPTDITPFITENFRKVSESKSFPDNTAGNPLFNDYPDAVFTLDLNGNFLSVNKNLIELAECTEDELLKLSFVPFICPEDLEMVSDKFNSAIQGEIQNFDARVVTAKGNHRILNITHIPIIMSNEVVGVYLIAKDVTAIKAAEQQLEENNQRISNILESVTDGFLALENNFTVTYWNKKAEQILLRSKDDVLGKNLWELYPEATPLKFYSEYHRAMAEGISINFQEYLQEVDCWLDVTAYPSEDGLSIYFKDISDRIRVEHDLKVAKAQYQNLFDLSPLPNWVFDLSTLEFLDVNEAAVNVYGFSREEFLSMSLKDIRPEEDVNILLGIIDDLNNKQRYETNTVRHVKKSGEIIFVETEGTTIFFKGKTARLVVVRDVTDRLSYVRSIEAQNKRLGEISWMQSHVVRAPLAQVIGLLELLTYDDPLDAKEQLLSCLRNSANELDRVIRAIIKKTEGI